MAVLTITNDIFELAVMQADTPVLLDFWAAWGGPCRMVSPLVDEIGEERDDIYVGKVNVDEEQELARTFQVSSIPTLAVVRDGTVTNIAVGARPKADILKLLED
jgi:thioredoxin 1